MSTTDVLRSTLLDAVAQDTILWSILKGRLHSVCDLPALRSLSNFIPELEGLMASALFVAGIVSRHASYGPFLQNLQLLYQPSAKARAAPTSAPSFLGADAPAGNPGALSFGKPHVAAGALPRRVLVVLYLLTVVARYIGRRARTAAAAYPVMSSGGVTASVVAAGTAAATVATALGAVLRVPVPDRVADCAASAAAVWGSALGPGSTVAPPRAPRRLTLRAAVYALTLHAAALVDFAATAGAFVHLCWFLFSGPPVSLVHRGLGLRYAHVPGRPAGPSAAPYSLLNLELLWLAVGEWSAVWTTCAGVLLRAVQRLWHARNTSQRLATATTASVAGPECVVCAERLAVPVAMSPCGHRACYVCVARPVPGGGAVVHDADGTLAGSVAPSSCPACSAPVERCARVAA
eukprot:TRINITY_DN12741_c0_g1_i1.p1 TRINITY_DN12741_c0_g1~~TRINITY_DN12741_c0_g1_i1.p1  ORF type:complete len:406 (-),score=49.67 TRINITY_DN12741_c0_g1_i1:389-1606(-)